MASLNDGGNLIPPGTTRVTKKNKELERVPLFLTETLTGQEGVREGVLSACFWLLSTCWLLLSACLLLWCCLSFGLVCQASCFELEDSRES